MNQYAYNGPVMEFGKCIANNWAGSTYAASEKKAKNNLAYQLRKIITVCQHQRLLCLEN